MLNLVIRKVIAGIENVNCLSNILEMVMSLLSAIYNYVFFNAIILSCTVTSMEMSQHFSKTQQAANADIKCPNN